MSVYEILSDTESQIYFVQVGTKPKLDRRITVAVKDNTLGFLTRTMVSKKKEKPYIYDWYVDGSLTQMFMMDSPYDSERKALESVLQVGFKVYIFDTALELAKFIIAWKK